MTWLDCFLSDCCAPRGTTPFRKFLDVARNYCGVVLDGRDVLDELCRRELIDGETVTVQIQYTNLKAICANQRNVITPHREAANGLRRGS